MPRLRTYAIWILSITILTTLFAAAAFAQDTPSDPPADPAALPSAGSPSAAQNNREGLTALGDWSLLTYQKLVGQNWDVFVHDVSGARRLTYSTADDQHPSLDRGTRRVAFVSDRFGDFDLFLVRANGTALQRILDTKDTIAFPAWSPDGRTIAIQARINGQYEIYLVNDNGSNPRRLTNNIAFDGMPAWSPDGSKLAFASDRSGSYRIYVMNADGGAVQRMSSYPLSLHPTWSPDGVSIAFDADVDGDGWQELAIVDANGKNERMIYNPAGANVTAWAGSWAPDKSSLAFNEITAEQQNGQWVWNKAVIRQWNPTSGSVDLIPGGKEWYVNWESSDDIAPITDLGHLPAYSKAENFTLNWSGVDQGGSGLKSYALYSNDGSGWRTYWGNTSATQAPFPAVPGQTVEFLVRAKDNAFNQGAWAQQNIERTTFYVSKVAGSISDNRGAPLWSVPITSAPAMSTAPVVSNWQGNFAGYTFAEKDYTISINEPNFKAMPNTTVMSGREYIRDIYLLPTDSRIKNGTFESSSVRPDFWTTAGTLPQAISSDDAATGRYAVRLGQAPASLAQVGLQNAGAASISQVVTIPAGMQGPTLSYMVRSGGAPPSGNSGLRVRIDPPTQAAATVINTTAADEWAMKWIDMAPWLGKEVTVTFELVQNAGDPAQTIFLDDISLGSINPNLWVFLTSGPGTAVPGEIVSITLDYGNHGPLPAPSSVVELALPPEIFLVSATPPYSVKNNVLRWEVGDLQPNGADRRLQIQVSPATREESNLTVKAFVHTAAEEAHLRDNTSQTSFQVIKNLYMPLTAGS